MNISNWLKKNLLPFAITVAFLLATTILITVMFYRHSLSIKLDQVYLRESPSPASKQVGVVNKGTRLSILKEEHGWYYLRREDNEKTGWVPSWIANAEKLPEGQKAPSRLSEATIVLDAGHGGDDPGSIGFQGDEKNPTYQEKTYTLIVAKLIQKELEKSGARVIMNRKDDSLIYLADLPKKSIENHADAFVSIHFDSTEAGTSGVDVITVEKSSSSSSSSKSSDETSSSSSSSSGPELETIVTPTASGRETFYYHDNGSYQLAQTVSDSLNNLNLIDRGIQQAEYAAVKNTDRPSILLELGFINNENDFFLIQSGEFQKKAAQDVAEGLKNYFIKVAPNLKFSQVLK